MNEQREPIDTRSPWRWRFGILFGSVLIAWLPYWLLNLFAGDPLAASWWRVPVGTRGVFDSYVYFNWLGAAANGLPAGDLLKWYALVVKGAWGLFSSWASVPEIWVVTRWLSILLVLAVGPWCLQTWSGIDRRAARLMTVAFTIAVSFSIGLRPGAYSWYLPIALVAFVSVWNVWRALQAGHLRRAIGWSIIGVVLASVYPWYFMFVGLWIASVWGAFLAARHAKTFYGIVAATVILVCTAAPWVALWFLKPEQAAFIGPYERSGIVFARVPFFANTLIAFGAWIVLFALLAYAYRSRDDVRDRLVLNGWAWLALAFLWLNTPITGIHLYSDHFIGPTVVLSWFSLASVVSAARETADIPKDRVLAAFRWLLLAIAGGATLFVVYVVQQPLRLHPLKFDSYAVHVIHWFGLALAAWIAVNRFRARPLFSEKRWPAILIVGGVIIGAWGSAAVVSRDARTVSELQRRIPAIAWLRDRVSPETSLCADVETASFFAAHTGLAVYPAEATLSYSVSNETVLRMLETIAGAYDVVAGGDLAMFRFETDHYRTIPCAAASKYSHNAFWDRLLARFGFDEAAINDYIGCRQDVIDANWARVSSAIERRTVDPSAFRRICPYVIIPDAQKANWDLPSDYRETWYGNGIGIWMSGP